MRKVLDKRIFMSIIVIRRDAQGALKERKDYKMTTYERDDLLDELELTDEELDAIAEEVELMDAMEHGIALF